MVTASEPSRAWPTTSSCGSDVMISCRTRHMNAESSTTSTRSFLSGPLLISILPGENARRRTALRCIRANQTFNRRNQLVFLHGLGQEGRRAFLHRAVAMLGSGARGDDENGDAARDGILAQMGHQLVAIHARHFEVGDQEMASDLGDDFGGFEAVGSDFHAIAGLFQHASNEFANADGIV